MEGLLFLISNLMQNFRKIHSAVPKINCDAQTHAPTHPRTHGGEIIVHLELCLANNKYGKKSFQTQGSVLLNTLKDTDIYKNAKDKKDFLGKWKTSVILTY